MLFIFSSVLVFLMNICESLFDYFLDFRFCRTCMNLAASRSLPIEMKKHYQQKLLELAMNSAGEL